jgi:hypothetical protein
LRNLNQEIILLVNGQGFHWAFGNKKAPKLGAYTGDPGGIITIIAETPVYHMFWLFCGF